MSEERTSFHPMNQPYISRNSRKGYPSVGNNDYRMIPSYESESLLKHSSLSGENDYGKGVYSQSSTNINIQSYEQRDGEMRRMWRGHQNSLQYSASEKNQHSVSNMNQSQKGESIVSIQGESRSRKSREQQVRVNGRSQQVSSELLHEKIFYLEKELQELTRLLQEESKHSYGQEYQELAIENAQLTIKVQQLQEQMNRINGEKARTESQLLQLGQEYQHSHKINNQLRQKMIQLQQRITSIQKNPISTKEQFQNKQQNSTNNEQQKNSYTASLQRQNSRLNEQIQNLLSKLHNINVEYSEQQMAKQQLMEKMNQQLLEIEKLRKEVSDLQVEKLQLEDMNQYLKQEITQINSISAAQLKQLQEKYIKQDVLKQHHYQQLSTQNQQLKAYIQNLQSQIKNIAKQYEELKKKTTNIQTQELKKKTTITQTQESKKKPTSQSKSQPFKQLFNNQPFKQLFNNQDNLKQQISLLNQQLLQEKQRHSLIKTQYNQMLQNQQSRLNQLQTQNTKLTQQIKTLVIQNRTIKVQLQDRNKQIAQIQKQMQQISLNNEQIKLNRSLLQTNKLPQSQRIRYQDNIKTLNELNKKLQQEKEQLFTQYQNNIRQLQTQLQNANYETQRLSRSLSIKQQQLRQKDYLAKELLELQHIHEELIQEVKLIRKSKLYLQDQINTQQQNTKFNQKTQINKLNQIINQKQRNIQLIQSHNNNKDILIASIIKQKQQLNNQLNKFNSEYGKINQLYQNLNRQHEKLNRQHEKLNRQHANLNRQHANLNQLNQKSNRELQKLRSSLKNCQSQLSSTKLQLQHFKSQLQNVISQLQNAKRSPSSMHSYSAASCPLCPQVLKQFSIYKQLMELKFQTMNQMLDQLKISFIRAQFQIKQTINRDKSKYEYWMEKYDSHDKEYRTLMQRLWEWEKINAKNQIISNNLYTNFNHFPPIHNNSHKTSIISGNSPNTPKFIGKVRKQSTQVAKNSPNPHLSELQYDLYLIKLQNSTLRSQISNMEKQLSQKGRSPQTQRQIEQLKKYSDNLLSENEQLKNRLTQITSQKKIPTAKDILMQGKKQSIFERYSSSVQNLEIIQRSRQEQKALASAELFINKLKKENDDLIETKRMLQQELEQESLRIQSLQKDLQAEMQKNRRLTQSINQNSPKVQVLDRYNLPIQYIKYHPQHKKLQSEYVSLKRLYLQMQLQYKKSKQALEQNIQKLKIQNDFHKDRINQLEKTQKSTNFFSFNTKYHQNDKRSKSQSQLSQNHIENKAKILQERVLYLEKLLQTKNKQSQLIAKRYQDLMKQLALDPKTPRNKSDTIQRIQKIGENIEVSPIQSPQWQQHSAQQNSDRLFAIGQVSFQQKYVQKLKACMDRKMIQLQITPRETSNLIVKATWFIQRLATDMKELRNNMEILKGQRKAIMKERNQLKEKLQNFDDITSSERSKPFAKNKNIRIESNPVLDDSMNKGLNKMKITKGYQSVPRLNFDSRSPLSQDENMEVDENAFNDVIKQTLQLKNQRRSGLKKFQQQLQKLTYN